MSCKNFNHISRYWNENMEWTGHRVIMDHGKTLRKHFGVNRWEEEEWEDLD